MSAGLALLLSLQVTYVANEGFLIASGEDKVLIDALHVPPAEVEDATRKIRQHLPDVVIFARSGETKIF